MKTFHSIEELKPYYNDKTNTYEFGENGVKIDVEFTFNLDVDSNIKAGDIDAINIKAVDIDAWNINAIDIKAGDIKALDIKVGVIKAGDIYAMDINALDINAGDISYYAVCFAYNNIVCTAIKGIRKNSKHFVLDGEIIFKQGEKNDTNL